MTRLAQKLLKRTRRWPDLLRSLYDSAQAKYFCSVDRRPGIPTPIRLARASAATLNLDIRRARNVRPIWSTC